MRKSKMLIFFAIAAFHAVVMANEADLPTEEMLTQEERIVNILGEGKEQSNVVIVREMTLREILLHRIAERHEMGLDLDITEEFIENLPNEEIEEIFRQDGEYAEIEETNEEKEEPPEEENQNENKEITETSDDNFGDYINENKEEAAVVGLVVGGAAVGYGIRRKEVYANESDEEDNDEDDSSFDDDNKENSVDFEDNYEHANYEEHEKHENNMEASSAIADYDAYFDSSGNTADAGELRGDSTAVDTGAVSRIVNADTIGYAEKITMEAAVAYMSKYAYETYGKDVPEWFWEVILQCEGSSLSSDEWKYFNNPGGMNWDSYMEDFGGHPATELSLHKNVRGVFPTQEAGLQAEVAWFCRPNADDWWKQEIAAVQNGDYKMFIRMHCSHYVRGTAELLSFEECKSVGPYYEVTHEVLGIPLP